MRTAWVIVGRSTAHWRVVCPSSVVPEYQRPTGEATWTGNLDLASKFTSEDEANQWMIQAMLVGSEDLFELWGRGEARQIKWWRKRWWWMTGPPS